MVANGSHSSGNMEYNYRNHDDQRYTVSSLPTQSRSLSSLPLTSLASGRVPVHMPLALHPRSSHARMSIPPPHALSASEAYIFEVRNLEDRAARAERMDRMAHTERAERTRAVATIREVIGEEEHEDSHARARRASIRQVYDDEFF
jgi:hypothetical protein